MSFTSMPLSYTHSRSASDVSQSPQTPAWSPSFTTVQSTHSPQDSMAPRKYPTLVRTSTVQQNFSSSSASVPGLQPYGIGADQACLKFGPDLDLCGVGCSWTPEELAAKRKLVAFTRKQIGNVIHAEFEVVAPGDWHKDRGRTVSCIWWEEMGEAYITSVDLIGLLETLTHLLFPVEEKNRVRRNLEGFHPATVSKNKPIHTEFFKCLMAFPEPKPRNIEKDLKVFKWSDLKAALDKIISKYSACPAPVVSTTVKPTTPAYKAPPAPYPVNNTYMSAPPQEPIVVQDSTYDMLQSPYFNSGMMLDSMQGSYIPDWSPCVPIPATTMAVSNVPTWPAGNVYPTGVLNGAPQWVNMPYQQFPADNSWGMMVNNNYQCT